MKGARDAASPDNESRYANEHDAVGPAGAFRFSDAERRGRGDAVARPLERRVLGANFHCVLRVLPTSSALPALGLALYHALIHAGDTDGRGESELVDGDTWNVHNGNRSATVHEQSESGPACMTSDESARAHAPTADWKVSGAGRAAPDPSGAGEALAAQLIAARFSLARRPPPLHAAENGNNRPGAAAAAAAAAEVTERTGDERPSLRDAFEVTRRRHPNAHSPSPSREII